MSNACSLGLAEPQPSAPMADDPRPPTSSEMTAADLVASQTLQGLLTPGLRSIHRAPSQPYELMLAEVKGLDEEGYVVVNLQNGQRLRVQLAVGCLIEPERDDLVQVFANRHGGWITMVLRRPDATSPVTLAAGERHVQVRAPSLSLVATEAMTLQAPRLEQRASLMDTAVQERATTVMGTDTLHTSSASWNVEGHLGMHSRTQLMTADSLMKINGGQIHMA